MSRARRRVAHRTLLLAHLCVVSACGAGDPGYDTDPPCDEPREVAFDSLPNGPPLGVEVGGVQITRTCGEAVVAREDGMALLLLVGGCVSFVPVDCVADVVHVVFDETQGAITFSLLASGTGGEPFFSATSSSLHAVPEGGWMAIDLARDEDDPPIARFDVSGGMSGSSGASAPAIVELTLLAR